MVSTHDGHPLEVPNMRAEMVSPSKLIPKKRPTGPKRPPLEQTGELEGGRQDMGPRFPEIDSTMYSGPSDKSNGADQPRIWGRCRSSLPSQR